MGQLGIKPALTTVVSSRDVQLFAGKSTIQRSTPNIRDSKSPTNEISVWTQISYFLFRHRPEPFCNRLGTENHRQIRAYAPKWARKHRTLLGLRANWQGSDAKAKW